MKIKQLPDIILERYLLNELPEERAREVKAFIKDNPGEAARLDELKISNTQILEEYIPEVQSRLIREMYDKEKRKFKKKPSLGITRILKLAVPAGAFVVVIAAVFHTGLKDDKWNMNIINRNNEITRIKGNENRLFIYRKNGEKIKELKDGDRAGNKDLLQIAYRVGMGKFAVILSIDGRSSVTLHYPEETGGPLKVKPGRTVYLTNSYELDDAPEFERFFLLVSDKKIDVDKIIAQAKIMTKRSDRGKTGNLGAGETIRELSLTIIKKD